VLINIASSNALSPAHEPLQALDKHSILNVLLPANHCSCKPSWGEVAHHLGGSNQRRTTHKHLRQ
jgi:hypothetical protein